jgi:hypothetical protein
MNKDIVFPKLEEDEIKALRSINLVQYISDGIRSLKNYFKNTHKKHSCSETILATIRYMDELMDDYPKTYLFYPLLFRKMYSRVFLRESAGCPIIEFEEEAIDTLKKKKLKVNRLMGLDDPYDGFEIVAILIVNCIFAEGLWEI